MLDYLAISLIFLAVITITLGIIMIHNLPGKVAKRRHHPQAEAIHVCSLVGLIAFPFWMVALVWAYVDMSPFNKPIQRQGGVLADQDEASENITESDT